MRFTKTRAVVGDFLSASQRAKDRREPSEFFAIGCRNEGVPGFTVLAGLSQSPRLSTEVSRGLPASNVRLVAPSGHWSRSCSNFAFASLHSGTVARQALNTAAVCAGVRFSRGTLVMRSRTLRGSASAFTSFVALVELTRKRPRLLFM